MFWQQEAGLGDAIFTPIYEVLKKRGVHFKFFHRVEELKLGDTNSNFVEQIRMTKQADLVNEEYDPLINVKGLPSWPNEPKYEEIKHQQAELLQEHHIDLESFWSNWSAVYKESFDHPLPEVVLNRGKDFDIIVYGIPVGSLPFLCGELLGKSPSLRATNKYIGRVPSLQFQLWGMMDFSDWPNTYYQHRLLDPMQRKQSFVLIESQYLLKTEDWETLNLKPDHLVSFVILKNVTEIPPSNYTLFPKEQIEKVKGSLIHDILEILRGISPKSFDNGKFNWTLLTDPMNRTGEERFDSQYLRFNINPSDLYTLILTNTSQYRIKTDGAGFNNIYFTGDWIQSGFSCCLEGAFTAGLLTSKAISGYPREIFWEQYIAGKQ